MSTYATVASLVQAFYRLVGSTSDDDALIEQGESVDAVAYSALTHGVRRAQEYMLDAGYNGWRTQSSALTFGTSTDGSEFVALPDDFLRAAGDAFRSALLDSDGEPWGVMVGTDLERAKGDGWYIRGDELWLLREAQHSTLVLDYYAEHDDIAVDLAAEDIDFPKNARGLIPAYAAEFAIDDGWFPRADPRPVESAVSKWEKMAKNIARQSKQGRRMRTRSTSANHYY